MTEKTEQVIRRAARRKQRGLTLVELMVVLVIIGLLTTVVALNVIPAGEQAAVQKARTDISMLENALDQYRLQLLSYPTSEQGLDALIEAPDNLGPQGIVPSRRLYQEAASGPLG